MGTIASISVGEYLTTSYRPDCNYVDGVVVGRNAGEYDHAKLQPRPPLFKSRHFEPAVITCAVGWYLRFSLSCREVEELLTKRASAPPSHITIWRWVKTTNGSWRVDETYVRVKGKWAYLYRAVDSAGARS